MEFIIDPESLNKFPIFSTKGKNILKQYIKNIQNGGANRSHINWQEQRREERKKNRADALKHQRQTRNKGLLTQYEISLYKLSNFPINILLVGELHSHIGGVTRKPNYNLRKEDMDHLKNYLFNPLQDILDSYKDTCCFSYYTEYPLPNKVILLQKYKKHDNYPEFKFGKRGGESGVISQLAINMYKLSEKYPIMLHAQSFDLRDSYLLIGHHIFMFMYLNYINKPNIEYINSLTIEQKKGDKFQNFWKGFKNLTPSNIDIKNHPINSEVKSLFEQNLDIIVNTLVNIYISIKNDGTNQHILEVISNCLLELNEPNAEYVFRYEPLTKLFTELFNYLKENNIFKNIVAFFKNEHVRRIPYIITNMKIDSFDRFRVNIPLYHNIITHYILEVNLRILKEYYKCIDLKLQERISPDKIIRYLKYKYIWMTDLYAFYRMFMKPKDESVRGITKLCKVQKNILFHGGSAHTENLSWLIKHVFGYVNELEVLEYRGSKTNIKEYHAYHTPTYTLHYVKDGSLLNEEHKKQMNEILNHSFSYTFKKDHKYTFVEDFKNNEYFVSYILILKDNKVRGLYFICNIEYAIKNHYFDRGYLKTLKVPTSSKYYYIYNFAIHNDERGNGLCNYLIGNSICFIYERLDKLYPEISDKSVCLVARNPEYNPISGISDIERGYAVASNNCYSKYMNIVKDRLDNSGSYCGNRNEFCFYKMKPKTDPVWEKSLHHPKTHPQIKMEDSDILDKIQNEFMRNCRTRYTFISSCTPFGEHWAHDESEHWDNDDNDTSESDESTKSTTAWADPESDGR